MIRTENDLFLAESNKDSIPRGATRTVFYLPASSNQDERSKQNIVLELIIEWLYQGVRSTFARDRLHILCFLHFPLKITLRKLCALLLIILFTRRKSF